MNAPVTRRALLGASTAAIGTVALPALALADAPNLLAPDADAALFDLVKQHREAIAAWEAACRHLEEARDRAWAARPPLPDTLTATPFDLVHGLSPSGRSHKSDGRAQIYFNHNDLDRLRAAEPVMSMVLDEDGQSLRPVPNLAGEARRREIVDSYDRWLAERADADRRHGLAAAEAVEEPLCESMEEAGAAVESYLPTTLAGIKTKAAWVLMRCDRADAALAFMRQLAGDAAPLADDEDADDVRAAA